MGHRTEVDEIVVRLKVDRVTHKDGTTEYIIGRTRGLRIDNDICIHIDESIVEATALKEV